MFTSRVIPARNLQKSYKTIIDEVKNRKKAVILTTNKKPQAAIVSLEDLERIEADKNREFARDLLQFAHEHKEELKGLPANLRERADDTLYSKP